MQVRQFVPPNISLNLLRGDGGMVPLRPPQLFYARERHMARRGWALAGLTTSLLAAGCCHCAAPYDYCQPTFLAQPGECCQPDARMNSAFCPMQVACADGVDGDGDEFIEGGESAPHAEVPYETVPPGVGSYGSVPKNAVPQGVASPGSTPSRTNPAARPQGVPARNRSNTRPPASSPTPAEYIPLNAPHAEIERTSATQALPASYEAGRKPLQLRR